MFFLGKKKKHFVEEVAEERRSAPRASADRIFRVEFKGGGFFGVSGNGSGKNISTAGLRFATFDRLKKKQRLHLKISFSKLFPGPASVTMPCEVVWISRPHGAQRNRIGCKFLNTEDCPQETETLRQFVRWVKRGGKL